MRIVSNSPLRLISYFKPRTFASRMSSAIKTTSFKVNPFPRSLYPPVIQYTPSAFKRQDESPDTQWYSQPRFVQHIDDGAISALKAYYGSFIKPYHHVLDICSSWVSHLPDDLKPERVVGYGMNEQELSRNPHLTELHVRDLNQDPSLREVRDGSIDVVICNVSIDYLTRPLEVMREIRRVLKDGGSAQMAFSNRCFPTKVIQPWMGMDDERRRVWVGSYFWACGGWVDVEEVVLREGGRGGFLSDSQDPMFVVRGTKAH